MTTPYTIYVYWTAATQLYADQIGSLSKARTIARAAWDQHHPVRVEIEGSDGLCLTATQPHGRGMLWTS